MSTIDWETKRHRVGMEPEDFTDRVAVELPLEITVDGQPLVVLMRLPGMDHELAVGFCLTEKVIEDADRVMRLERRGARGGAAGPRDAAAGDCGDRGDVIDVVLKPSENAGGFSSPVLGRSGFFGVDRASIDNAREGRITSRVQVTERVVFGLGEELTRGQEIFQGTAGAHGAGIFTSSGELLVATEDVGRHNALDKAVGWCAMRGIPLEDKILFNSGRISCAMTLKAVRMGIPVLVSMAASTSLVLRVAEQAGLTVVGFSTGRKFTVYTHPERIV